MVACLPRPYYENTGCLPGRLDPEEVTETTFPLSTFLLKYFNLVADIGASLPTLPFMEVN